MNDQVKYRVELDFQTSGADKEINNLRELQRGIDEVARAGGVTEKTQTRLTKATSGVGAAAREVAQSHLPRLRYAVYDVSNTLVIAGGAMTAFSVLSVKAAIDYERAFANVIRTNDELMASSVASDRAMRRFMDLAGEIPTTFADLSQIGTLAGQLGIQTSRLEDFTRTVAMFAATTGVSLDQTATAFGRLDALLPDVQGNFDALGSSILNVGINSVATESEIIRITTQLAGVSRQAGLTTDELVGLAGSLASVGVQPELARGTVTRLFGQISRAVTTGGESLDGFARISGRTSDQFVSDWNDNAMDTVVDIFRGLRDRGGEAEAALRAVGITSVRDVPAILRLAQTVDSVLVPALGDAKDGFEEGTHLADNYGVIAQTVASRLQILVNEFQNLMATVGNITGPLAVAVDVLRNMLATFRQIADTPVVGFIAQLGVVLTAAAGGLMLFVSLLGRGLGGYLAWKTAVDEMTRAKKANTVAVAENSGALAGNTAAINANSTAAVNSSKSVRGMISAFRALNLVLGVTVAIGIGRWAGDQIIGLRGARVEVEALTRAFQEFNVQVDEQDYQKITDGINAAIESIGAATGPATGFLSDVFAADIDDFSKGFAVLGADLSQFENSIAQMQPGIEALTSNVGALQEVFIQAWETAGSERARQQILDVLDGITSQMSTDQIANFKNNFADLYDVIGSGVNEQRLAAEAVQELEGEYESLLDTMRQVTDEVFQSVNDFNALEDAMASLGESYFDVGAAAAFSGDSFQSAINLIVEQSGSAGAAASNLQVLYDFILQNTAATADDLQYLIRVIAQLQGLSGGRFVAPTMSFGDFENFVSGFDRATRSATRAGRATRQVQKEVRTLLDYASDLARVWDRAFDIRFDRQSTLDKITSSFNSIREAAVEAAKRIRDLNNDIAGLNSDISLQEYFLSIAIEYGDTARAEKIEADLTKMRADLADKTADLQKEQDSLDKSLVGNSQNNIENRNTIVDLVSMYQDYLRALAESGTSQGDLANKARELREDFIRQGAALGFSRTELETYARAFDDVVAATSAVRFDVTTDLSSLDPALLAIREFAEEANKALNSLGSGVGGSLERDLDPIPRRIRPKSTAIGNAAGTAMGAAFGGRVRTDIPRAALQGVTNAQTQAQGLARAVGGIFGIQAATGFRDRSVGGFASGAQAALNQSSSQARDNAFNMGNALAGGVLSGLTSRLNLLGSTQRGVIRGLIGFRQGGYTGPGGANEPAGIVHKGEYVIPKHEVNQATGLPYADALGRLMGGIQSRSTAPSRGSGGGTGAGVVDLSAGTIQALAHAVQTHIYLNGRDLADASAQSYANDSVNGRY